MCTCLLIKHRSAVVFGNTWPQHKRGWGGTAEFAGFAGANYGKIVAVGRSAHDTHTTKKPHQPNGGAGFDIDVCKPVLLSVPFLVFNHFSQENYTQYLADPWTTGRKYLFTRGLGSNKYTSWDNRNIS